MTCKPTHFLSCLITFLITVLGFTSVTADTISQKPEDFVRAFYAQYDSNHKTYFAEQKQLENLIDPKLYQLLLLDDKNRAKQKGEICGFVDFEPFLNTQEDIGPIKKLVLLPATPNPQVAVYFGTDAKPNFIVQLTSEKNHWKIANILYPNATFKENKDLITLLTYLQQEKCD